MRRTALSVAAVVVLIAGCGGGKSGKNEKSSTATTSTTAKIPPKPSGPQYVPSAPHSHRPPGSVYDDEIGENVLTAPYSRIIQLFGPPASRHGRCIKYKIVGRSNDRWTFCFRGEKMISASG
jgi:hypothetical protein